VIFKNAITILIEMPRSSRGMTTIKLFRQS